MGARKSKTATRINGKTPYIPYVDPERDAWYTAFFIENHMDYFAYPEHVGTPEQVRFMVYTEDEERYYPCSDRMFEAICRRRSTQLKAIEAREIPRYLKEAMKLLREVERHLDVVDSS